MVKVKAWVILLLGLVAWGCGPETIFVRPSLDTPAQHVANGHQLLDSGKAEDACREFNRAKELDPHFFRAYLGLGLALGLQGDIKAGLAAMDRAEQLAGNEQELTEVRKALAQFDDIKRKQAETPTP